MITKIFEQRERTMYEMNGTTLDAFKSDLVQKTNCDETEAERIAEIIRKDYEACCIKDDLVVIDTPLTKNPSVFYDKTDEATLACFGRPTCFSIGVNFT